MTELAFFFAAIAGILTLLLLWRGERNLQREIRDGYQPKAITPLDLTKIRPPKGGSGIQAGLRGYGRRESGNAECADRWRGLLRTK
jgi:hypothetical protein